MRCRAAAREPGYFNRRKLHRARAQKIKQRFKYQLGDDGVGNKILKAANPEIKKQACCTRRSNALKQRGVSQVCAIRRPRAGARPRGPRSSVGVADAPDTDTDTDTGLADPPAPTATILDDGARLGEAWLPASGDVLSGGGPGPHREPFSARLAACSAHLGLRGVASSRMRSAVCSGDRRGELELALPK
jgi:hypothetical protein